jgi:3-oxoacyl-[acyl-carrier protein] reductase
MDLGLTGRVYIVTGGSKGLGFATAAALVAEGARVVVSSRIKDNVSAAAERLGTGAIGLPADLAKQDSPQRLVDAALDWQGRLDGALISVGGPPKGSITGLSDWQWRLAFESVFLGMVRCAREVGSAVSADGAIGMVLSSSARSPVRGLSISNGFRPGLAMLAKDMSDELGERGVRVFGLLPGWIETERTRELDEGDPELRRSIESTIPLRRYGQPEEFGRVATFLLSPAASYVTGSVIPVDGGILRSL